MHKLYDVTCTIISSDIAPDIFADSSIFTEEEPSTQVDTFNTFQDFFDAVSSHKYPWSIPGSNYTYGISRSARHSLQSTVSVLTTTSQRGTLKPRFLFRPPAKSVLQKTTATTSSKGTCPWIISKFFCKNSSMQTHRPLPTFSIL